MLILGLMMMLSFNLSQAIHERIRLQQHSDAQAFSMAVVEARALNYFAYSNRAIAAAYVAMTSLHAYMASASITGPMMEAGASNFSDMAKKEQALCCLVRCKGVCCNQPHCTHASNDSAIANKYSKAAKDYREKAKGLDAAFRKTTAALDEMLDSIHGSQLAVKRATETVLRNGVAEVKAVNAPQASGLGGVGAQNINQFGCALEGTELSCSGGASEAPQANRSKVMTEVANATRPDWPARRSPGSPDATHLHQKFLMNLRLDIPMSPGEPGTSTPSGHGGTARISSDTNRVDSGNQGDTGTNLGATERGTLKSQKHCFTSSSSYSSEVHSNPDGGRHRPGGSHEGDHKFEGVQAQKSCTSNGNCFINFRATPDANKDYGQPSVYAYATQDLRARQTESGGWTTGAPWELNSSGSVALTHGAQGTGRLRLPPGTGAALSKAKVYYHKPDDWREHPNMFNPYWKAKLHPFKRAEAVQVLKDAPDTESAGAAAIGPVN